MNTQYAVKSLLFVVCEFPCISWIVLSYEIKNLTNLRIQENNFFPQPKKIGIHEYKCIHSMSIVFLSIIKFYLINPFYSNTRNKPLHITV